MLVSFQNVSKYYSDKTHALEDVSFDIDKGEFVFLVGTSGAGKTTILRLLLRDIELSKGKIFVDEKNISKLPKAQIPQLRRTIGMIFQDFKVLPDQTVFENVAIALEILGRSKNEINDKVKEVIRIVGLTQKLNFFPVQLSAGELQRVAIARAIVGAPKILLADEPTGNLDPATSWDILKIIKEINKFGTTVIMATHNIDIVNSMKKRVIVLKNGKIIKDQKNGKYR